MGDHAKRICDEYQYLLEKSQQYFASLRDLPAVGRKQYQPYFLRTFEVYTKLWRFQQEHRAVLESREHFSLKRYEIGEMASKIGQLYYHYYLRTSDTAYLMESSVFYEAIRSRSYFANVLDAKSDALMVKKLRYFARYIVTVLLMNDWVLARTLLQELESAVGEYQTTFKASDVQEWQLVMQEIKSFIEHSEPVVIGGSVSNPYVVSYAPSGLSTKSPSSASHTLSVSAEMEDKGRCTVQECIIVGAIARQTKLSELTLDMYRMLQVMESQRTVRQKCMESNGGAGDDDKAATVSTVSSTASATSSSAAEMLSIETQNSPSKYLLYYPSVESVLTCLSSVQKELLAPNEAWLLYVSGESKTTPSGEGVCLAKSSCDHVLYPSDLVPFLRRPAIVLADTVNAEVFLQMESPFQQPLLIVAAPVPRMNKETVTTQGSLLTAFLHAPLVAFCELCEIKTLKPELYNFAMEKIRGAKAAFDAAWKEEEKNLDVSLRAFSSDIFIRKIIFHVLLLDYVCRYHAKLSLMTNAPPVMKPSLPDSLSELPILNDLIHHLVSSLGVEHHFKF